jgi:polysaccharide deacetylase family protein (PEP-CTERM system associated)
VEANIDRILGVFAAGGVKATFFTLGWIAERYPEMVKRIVAEGHELASHGYGHLRASDQTRAEFDQDIRSSKALLEDLGGQAVVGYRAPSFSIGEGNLWALEALSEAGYRYSSSIYPIAHDHYGMPNAPRFAFYPNGPDGLLEVPITTAMMMGKKLPAGGGGYFRLLPYALSKWMMEKVNRDDREPTLFYFHPWELDPGQPRPEGLDAKSRFRHYVNIDRMERRLAALTRDFAWDRMDRIFLK